MPVIRSELASAYLEPYLLPQSCAIHSISRNCVSRLSIRVADAGIGMTSEEQSRVFDAFSQGRHAEEDSHRYEGLGLGLSISRMLVELHSGEIRAESAGPGRGSVCTIELPLVSLISAKN
jgi:signal transduction histidine kinase